MVASKHFPLLAFLVCCTAKSGQPGAEPTRAPAPPAPLESGSAGAPPTSAEPAPAQPLHVALEADDPSLPAEQRAAALVSRLTLEEKAAQLGHAAPAIPRLHVPQYNWWNEGLHGVARAGVATVFPQAIGMAATWDVELIQETADAIATEFRAKYADTVLPDGGTEQYRGLSVWSPNVNIFRDPRWGRGQETYGEDPYLTSRIGVAFVRGLQGDDPRYLKTVATPKHFAVHSGPESNRHKEDVHVSPHDLHDTYLPAFRATVIEGKARSVMCAYNAVDGVPACASEPLLDRFLRKSWGFDGFVVTDCGAAANIYREDSLHFSPTPEAGVSAGFKAGMDLICGDYRNQMTTDAPAIVAATKQGLLPEAVIDRALVRLFTGRFALGLFDPPGNVPWSKITKADYDTPAHRQLSQRVARESLVLLKNAGGLLPLKAAPKTIAVVGPNADSVEALVGNYNGEPSQPVTVLEGIRRRFATSNVVYAQGVGLTGPMDAPVPVAALCPDAACTTRGLRAEHFDSPDLSGAPARTETGAVELSWRERRRTSVRWTGTLTAPESGEYQFGFVSNQGYRIWVDGQLIANDWSPRDAPAAAGGKVRLEAQRSYAVKIEASQWGRRGDQRWVWSLPSYTGGDALAAARQADLVVMVAGLSARIEGEELRFTAPGFKGGDRTSLDLPASQQQLLERVAALGKPVVLVLMNGSAMAVNWADRHLPAIVQAWYPGGDGGSAVASLLAGDFSPAGRLPVTFYKSVEQLPPFGDYSMSRRTYRYFDGEPLYPFGYGQSYTRFEYQNARVSAPRIAATGSVNISVDVTNSGGMASDEVVQLYLSHPSARQAGIAGAPRRTLQGFQRIHLAPGERKTVELTLRDRQLSVVDAAGVRKIVPGQVDVWVGGGQPSSRAGAASAGARTAFEVTDGATLAE
ncbi:MAG TPA: glycoside hydrolase family 3 C-terminal domain-containing protein [Polyangiaceae bacterium]|nr:glycoside hydrolase family 3 C-terminal domain-containing protein [Polyangiaceae bacterium]